MSGNIENQEFKIKKKAKKSTFDNVKFTILEEQNFENKIIYLIRYYEK